MCSAPIHVTTMVGAVLGGLAAGALADGTAISETAAAAEAPKSRFVGRAAGQQGCWKRLLYFMYTNPVKSTFWLDRIGGALRQTER